MKKLLISAALAGLFAGTPAFAQGHDDHHDQGHPEQGHQNQGHPDQGHHDQRPAPDHAAAQAHHDAAIVQRDNATAHRDNAMVRQDNAAVHRDNNMVRDQQHAIAREHNNVVAAHRDFSAYRRNVTAARHFHAQQAYRRPAGWYDHRWTFGERLPANFWVQDYWITDYNDYALQAPPDGAVWVRYGNDALLIDQDTGEVIQTEYGVFY